MKWLNKNGQRVLRNEQTRNMYYGEAYAMLGFSPAPSAKVVTEILRSHPDTPVEMVIKMALKMIK